MIRAKHTAIGVIFFTLYTRLRLHRNFKNIRFSGKFNDNGRPVLIIANHFSWWDGFIQKFLNNKYIHRKFHVMMLEEQLRQNMILNTAGCFSIKKSSKDIVESLNYCTQLLSDSKNMLLIFPQGEIQSIYTRQFVFEQGLQYIAKRVGVNVQLIFNVNLVDYFSDSKPSLTIYFKNYELTATSDIKQIEADFNNYVVECIEKQAPL